VRSVTSAPQCAIYVIVPIASEQRIQGDQGPPHGDCRETVQEIWCTARLCWSNSRTVRLVKGKIYDTTVFSIRELTQIG
jgi:hypothetical protein